MASWSPRPSSTARVGRSLYSGRWVIDEIGPENFAPGDVVIHNDPYRGGSHMPEHLLVSPVFYKGGCAVLRRLHRARRRRSAAWRPARSPQRHGGYQEGLRLPPVKLLDRGET